MAVRHYRGTRRDGSAGTGATTESLTALVRRKHQAGWRSLVVTEGDREVGWISRLADGKRVWWVDTQ